MSYDWDAGSVWFKFSYDGSSIRLDTKQVVRDAAPPSRELGELAGQGFWSELRDGNGGVLYRWVMADPVALTVEAPLNDEGQLGRRMLAAPAGFFTVLVPNLPSAQSLVLVSSPLDNERSGEAARDIYTVTLGEGNIA